MICNIYKNHDFFFFGLEKKNLAMVEKMDGATERQSASLIGLTNTYTHTLHMVLY